MFEFEDERKRGQILQLYERMTVHENIHYAINKDDASRDDQVTNLTEVDGRRSEYW